MLIPSSVCARHSASSKMKPKYHIFLPDNRALGDYDDFDVTNAVFILYSESTGTEYQIDADEVIKMMDNPDVELSSRAKDMIDSILIAAFAM